MIKVTFSNSSTLFLIVPKLQKGATDTSCTVAFFAFISTPKNYYYGKNHSYKTMALFADSIYLQLQQLFFGANSSLLHR